MPFYILAAGLIVVCVAVLLLGGGTLTLAGGVGSIIVSQRTRQGRRVPRGLRGTTVVALLLGLLMITLGLAVAVFNVLVAVDVIN